MLVDCCIQHLEFEEPLDTRNHYFVVESLYIMENFGKEEEVCIMLINMLLLITHVGILIIVLKPSPSCKKYLPNAIIRLGIIKLDYK